MSEKEVYGVIYVIENKVNGKKYVGQTTSSVKKRFNSHRYSYRNGSNNLIHKALRKYGEDSFIIKEIDVAIDKHDLDEKEIYHIEKLNSHISAGGYNMTIGGESTSYQLRGTNNHQAVSVINLDTKEVFKTIGDAVNRYELTSMSGIGRSCRGELRTYGGYKWAYYGDYVNNTIPEFKSVGTHNVKVINLDTLEVFCSIKDAMNKYDIKSKKISDVCRGDMVTCGGYRWAYYKDFLNNTIPKSRMKTRKVKIINLDTGEIFNSLKEASISSEAHKDSISNCIRGVGGQKTAGGYRWQYYEDYLKENT